MQVCMVSNSVAGYGIIGVNAMRVSVWSSFANKLLVAVNDGIQVSSQEKSQNFHTQF